jgi:hypothetical protein
VTGALAAAGELPIAAVRRDLAERFRAGGIDSPDLDARLLVGHALGLDHASLVRDGERRLDRADIAGIEALAARRLAGEPVARITGVKEFWGLPIPRPWWKPRSGASTATGRGRDACASSTSAPAPARS